MFPIVLLCFGIYLVIGFLVNAFVHTTHMIVYEDRTHQLKSNLLLIVTWPYVLVALIVHR